MTEIKKLSERGSTKPNSQYYTDSIYKLHQKHEKIKRFLNKTSEKINGGTDEYGDGVRSSLINLELTEDERSLVNIMKVLVSGQFDPDFDYAQRVKDVYGLEVSPEDAKFAAMVALREKKEKALQIHRFYAAMEYEKNIYGVKMTVREKRNGKTVFYTLEAHDLEIQKINPAVENNRGGVAKAASPGRSPGIHFSMFFEKFKPINDLLGLKYKEDYPFVRFSVAPDEELEQTVGQLVVWLTGKGNKGYFYDITDIKYDRKAGIPLMRESPTGALPEEEGQLRTHLPVSSNLPSSAENASGEKKNARFSPRICAFALRTVTTASYQSLLTMFIFLPTTYVPTLSPATLQAVSNISSSGLIPRARATITAVCASVRLKPARTRNRRNTLPPGIPPAPTDANTTPSTISRI